VSELVAVSSAGLPVEVERPVRHALVIATIGAVSWLAASVAFLVEDSVLHRVKVDVRDNRRARRRTRCAVSAPDLPGAQCLTLLQSEPHPSFDVPHRTEREVGMDNELVKDIVGRPR